MLEKTRGVVLNYFKFKETSVITKIYTEKFGIQSYIINGIRSKNSKKSLALFQPLSLLDLVVYIKKNENSEGGIKRLSEFKSLIAFQSIPFNIKKTAIAIFITELVNKTLKEESSEENGIFDFLNKSILFLDHVEVGYESFHIHFMIRFANYIGFGITSKNDINIVSSRLIGMEDMEQLTQIILKLSLNDYEILLPLSNEQRKALLNLLLSYYSSHIDGFKTMKSKSILQQVFN